MIFVLFLKGFLIGFSIAMPIGPIGLLCIRNSLALGIYGGIASGLGSSTVDALFGYLAGIGISSFNNFLQQHEISFHAIGALILCYIGIMILRDTSRFEKSQEQTEKQPIRGLSYAFFSTFLLTLINPLTIFSYAAIYSAIALDILQSPGMQSALTVAGGVFFGALIWWLILSMITVSFKKKMAPKHLRWLNISSGSFIICLGLGTLVAAFL
jgi:threonine/homoserine/homoserine lactone efflux protein